MGVENYLGKIMSESFYKMAFMGGSIPYKIC
jgi:hypothetical protein